MTDRPEGLRLVADNVRSWEWESGDRRKARPPRYRLAPLRSAIGKTAGGDRAQQDTGNRQRQGTEMNDGPKL